jgi:hypothetical protein
MATNLTQNLTVPSDPLGANQSSLIDSAVEPVLPSYVLNSSALYVNLTQISNQTGLNFSGCAFTSPRLRYNSSECNLTEILWSRIFSNEIAVQLETTQGQVYTHNRAVQVLPDLEISHITPVSFPNHTTSLEVYISTAEDRTTWPSDTAFECLKT